jgi:hypothetical protein
MDRPMYPSLRHEIARKRRQFAPEVHMEKRR